MCQKYTQAKFYIGKGDDCRPELLSRGEALELLHCSQHKHSSITG